MNLSDFINRPMPDLNPPKRLSDPIGFGKYAQYTIEQLLELYPDYLDWALRNTDLTVEVSVIERLEEMYGEAKRLEDEWQKEIGSVRRDTLDGALNDGLPF